MAEVTPASMEFGGLFTAKLNPDGNWTGALGPKTQPRAHQLATKLKLVETVLTHALLTLGSDLRDETVPIPVPKEQDPFGMMRKGSPKAVLPGIPLYRTNIFEISEAAYTNTREANRLRQTLECLSAALGGDLKVLIDRKAPAADRGAALKRLKRLLGHVLECLSLGKVKLDPRIDMVICDMEDGSKKPMLLPWLILHLAPRLLEETQALPTKKALRDYVEARYPSAKFSTAKWTTAFKDAGLESLPRDSKW